MYDQIKEVLKPYRTIYNTIKFLITPYRFIRERVIRRKLACIAEEEYSKFDRSKRTIFYLGIPEHNNLGDIAQTYCTCKWIKENYPDSNLLKVRTKATHDKKFIDFIKNNISSNDIIFFQSGYCTRYKNPDHIMHKHIASCFPLARMIVLPQTVKLLNNKDQEETKSIFSKCEKLTFICRDKISYNSAKYFLSIRQIELFPDIVTSLIGRMKYKKRDRSGALICVRNDDEKFYTDQQIKVLYDNLKTVFKNVEIRDTNSPYSLDYTFSNLDKVIEEMVSIFSQYEVIITDRFHGTIFSLIADTPVIVVKTNDHKVLSAIEWFDGLFPDKSVQFSDDLIHAYSKAKEIHELHPSINNPPVLYNSYFKEKLYGVVERCNRV